jgi:citrate synthase
MALAAVPKTAPATDRLRVIVSVIGAGDPLRSDLRPAGAVATARRLMGTTIAALTTLRRGSVAGRVSAWLGPRRPRPDTVRTVERTLVMMADHELAASTLAVRVAASFGADPYAAALAGLGVMSGAWHGGASGRVERLLDDVAQGQSAKSAIGALLQHEGAIPGFGQRLYPAGDPRVAVLWPLARSFGPTVEADALITVARSQGLPPPNVDFALATLVRALGLAPGAGEALFTIGRLAGWMAHAIEEYTERSEFRMRAIYTGPRPG